MSFSILNLNEDCFFQMFKWMEWKDILLFGSSNSKMYAIVKRYIEHKQFFVNLNVGTDFDFSAIFQLYGNFIEYLQINVEKIISESEYFDDDDELECFVYYGYGGSYYIDIIKDNCISEYSFFVHKILNALNSNPNQKIKFINISYFIRVSGYLAEYDCVSRLQYETDQINLNIFQNLKFYNMTTDIDNYSVSKLEILLQFTK